MQLVLVGFMGTGKTSIGTILSRHGLFIDLDQRIESKTSISILELFENHGEDKFRDLEYQCLRSVFDKESFILATGGGVVEDSRSFNMLLEHASVIWLHASFSTIKERLSNSEESKKRPLWDDAVFERYMRRQSLYARCCTDVISVDCRSVEEVAELIINRYG